jgi:sugar (pentulose or hexulose) kinase
MKKIKVTAVFDIGKTNKKFFLFDQSFREVHKEYIRFEEVEDEDGHPTENLLALQKWLKDVFHSILDANEYDVKAINFSTYGASLVHIDENGYPLIPFYNYTKPLPKEIVPFFLKQYGPKEAFLKATGCVDLSMLNSGLQLYWIKKTRPELYGKIKYSLHLPQYLSYVFAGIPVSEYTSIGCHTALWDYEKKDYHNWVYNEGIDLKLPPIVPTETIIDTNYRGKPLKIGVGIHDSSSALLPYVRSLKKKFLLISTGTWSISFNPFIEKSISDDFYDSASINYMRINGKVVKASRLFLGNEYKLQVEKLNKHFDVSNDYHKSVTFNHEIYHKINDDFKYHFKWESLEDGHMPNQSNLDFDDYDHAYHQLMAELVLLQVKSVEKAIGDDKTDRLYIDGGFSDNDLYVKLLTYHFPEKKVRTTDASLGSALGAAIVISDTKLNSKFLKENYALKKHAPLILN